MERGVDPAEGADVALIISFCVLSFRGLFKPFNPLRLRQARETVVNAFPSICQLGALVQVVGALQLVTRASRISPPSPPWPGGQEPFGNDARPVRIIPCDTPGCAKNDRPGVATWPGPRSAELPDIVQPPTHKQCHPYTRPSPHHQGAGSWSVGSPTWLTDAGWEPAVASARVTAGFVTRTVRAQA